MSAPESPSEQALASRQRAGEDLLSKFDAFDVVAERAAISVLKLASWMTTVAVVLYGLWKSF